MGGNVAPYIAYADSRETASKTISTTPSEQIAARGHSRVALVDGKNERSPSSSAPGEDGWSVRGKKRSDAYSKASVVGIIARGTTMCLQKRRCRARVLVSVLPCSRPKLRVCLRFRVGERCADGSICAAIAAVRIGLTAETWAFCSAFCRTFGSTPTTVALSWCVSVWIRFTGRTPTARDRLPLAAQQLAVFSEVHQRVLGV